MNSHSYTSFRFFFICLTYCYDTRLRDLAVANVTEKMTKLERELRNSNSEYDKAMADLHVR